MSETQRRRKILSAQTDTEAAKTLEICIERARQLRLELLVPVSTYQITTNRRIAEHKAAYEEVSEWTDPLPGRSRTMTWKKAWRYAIAHDLPWPPANVPEYVPPKLTIGKQAYEMYADDPGIKWKEVLKRIDSCEERDTRSVWGLAMGYAKHHDLPWPLKRTKRND
jgi:hypothetical protein